MNWPFGLHHHGMHDWLMDEIELGARVALILDDENNGWRLPCLSMEVEAYEHR